VKETDTQSLLLLSSPGAGTTQRTGVLLHRHLQLLKKTVRCLECSFLARAKGGEWSFMKAIETAMLPKTMFSLLLTFCYV